MATLNEGLRHRPPRLPLLHLHGAITRYKNEVFQRMEEVDELDSETLSEVDKDDKIADLELKCLLSLQKRKDRALSRVLLESSDFLSPRSGCLTPLSSARGPHIGAHQTFSQALSERECISVPNSSRESVSRKDRSLGPPLQDSLRSRFCKHTTSRENSDLLQIENTDLLIKGPLEQKLIEQGITPVYEPKGCQGTQQCSLLPLIPDVSDLRVFLVCPGLKSGGHIQCHIRRVVSTYKLYPRYKLYLTKGNIFLLSARKRKRSKCSNYLLSLDEEDISRRTGNYFGNLRSYCLNFHGRATHASVKNFQLVTEYNDEHILLQLGKVGKNFFTMDYCYPMSALQAFSIAISTLDRKFA